MLNIRTKLKINKQLFILKNYKQYKIWHLKRKRLKSDVIINYGSNHTYMLIGSSRFED